VDKTTGVLGG